MWWLSSPCVTPASSWVVTPYFSLSSLHHFPLSWKEWSVDPAEQFYYVWLQVMILPIVYNSVIIILRYKHGILWWVSNRNRVAEHIACNHLAFIEMFLLGRASLQLPWVTCLCGSRWTICLTSCIFLTWSSPFTRVNISFCTLWFSLWNKN